MTLSNNAAILLALLLSYAGWGMLSMSMARHLHDTLGITPATGSVANAANASNVTNAANANVTSASFKTAKHLHLHLPAVMRMAAVFVLFLSLIPLILLWGAPIGIVAWCGLLSLNCLLLAWQLHYASRTVRVSVSVAALAAAVAAFLPL